jgi:hypothetical protein
VIRTKTTARVLARVARWFLFKPKKSQFGQILEDPRLENVDIFYGHLKYFTDIWDILGPFGTFVCSFGNFSGFGILCK